MIEEEKTAPQQIQHYWDLETIFGPFQRSNLRTEIKRKLMII